MVVLHATTRMAKAKLKVAWLARAPPWLVSEIGSRGERVLAHKTRKREPTACQFQTQMEDLPVLKLTELHKAKFVFPLIAPWTARARGPCGLHVIALPKVKPVPTKSLLRTFMVVPRVHSPMKKSKHRNAHLLLVTPSIVLEIGAFGRIADVLQIPLSVFLQLPLPPQMEVPRALTPTDPKNSECVNVILLIVLEVIQLTVHVIVQL